jgi:hypothetical protein
MHLHKPHYALRLSPCRSVTAEEFGQIEANAGRGKWNPVLTGMTPDAGCPGPHIPESASANRRRLRPTDAEHTPRILVRISNGMPDARRDSFFAAFTDSMALDVARSWSLDSPVSWAHL